MDIVDHTVGKVLDILGIEQYIVRALGRLGLMGPDY